MKTRVLQFDSYDKPSGMKSMALVRLFWPVDVFRVTIPSTPDSSVEINVFERLVLRLLEMGATRSVEALSGETGMDKDLVETIVRQLQDKGFIDRLLRPGKEIVQMLLGDADHEAEQTFSTAMVFRERLQDKLLPYIHVITDDTPLYNAAPPDVNKGDINLLYFARTLKSLLPRREEIRSLLMTYNARSRMAGARTGRINARFVNVGSSAERILLQCSLVFDESRPVVANPFGAGFSSVLTAALSESRRNNPALDEKISGLEVRFTRSSHRAKAIPHDRVSPQTRKHYPELADALRHDILNSADVYGALEWALYYSSCHAPVDEALFLIQEAIRQDELPEKLLATASRIGFKTGMGTTRFVGFAPVPSGKILDYRSGKADMNTVLAISLIQAEIHPEIAPFARIAKEMQDFFQNLFWLRGERNPEQHGEKVSRAKKDTGEWERWVSKAIKTLLPDVVFSSTDTGLEEVRLKSATEERIACRLRLQAQFGFSVFSRFTEEQISNLVDAERNAAIDADDANRQRFASAMCNVLQTLLDNRIRSADFRDGIGNEPFDSALAIRARTLGLAEVLSRRCFNIKIQNRRKAELCDPRSLGACVLCYVAREDEDVLRLLTDTNPRWAETVAYLLELRGHGNEPRPLPKKKITPIRDESLRFIQNLMEVMPCH